MSAKLSRGEENSVVTVTVCAAFLPLPSQTRLRSGSALLQSQSSTEDPKDEPAELKQDSEDLATQSAASKASQEEVN